MNKILMLSINCTTLKRRVRRPPLIDLEPRVLSRWLKNKIQSWIVKSRERRNRLWRSIKISNSFCINKKDSWPNCSLFHSKKYYLESKIVLLSLITFPSSHQNLLGLYKILQNKMWEFVMPFKNAKMKK